MPFVDINSKNKTPYHSTPEQKKKSRPSRRITPRRNRKRSPRSIEDLVGGYQQQPGGSQFQKDLQSELQTGNRTPGLASYVPLQKLTSPMSDADPYESQFQRDLQSYQQGQFQAPASTAPSQGPPFYMPTMLKSSNGSPLPQPPPPPAISPYTPPPPLSEQQRNQLLGSTSSAPLSSSPMQQADPYEPKPFTPWKPIARIKQTFENVKQKLESSPQTTRVNPQDASQHLIPDTPMGAFGQTGPTTFKPISETNIPTTPPGVYDKSKTVQKILPYAAAAMEGMNVGLEAFATGLVTPPSKNDTQYGPIGEPKTWEERVKEYYQKPPLARAALEMSLAFMLPGTGLKFGAINEPNTMRKAASIASDTALLALGEPGPLRKPINALWDSWHNLVRTPYTKARNLAQDTKYVTNSLLDDVSSFSHVAVEGKRVGDTVAKADDIVDTLEKYVRDPSLWRGEAAPEAAALLKDVDVRSLPAIQAAKADPYKTVHLGELNAELSDKLMEKALIKQGALKPGQTIKDYKPNIVERFNNNMKAIVNVAWLMSGRYPIRNATNNYTTLLVDGIGVNGFDAVKYNQMRKMFNLDPITDQALELQNQFMGAGSFTSKMLDKTVPFHKEFKKFTSGTGILGEQRARNIATYHVADRGWKEFWVNKGRGVTSDYKGSLFPKSETVFNGSPIAPKLSQLADETARSSRSLSEMEYKLRDVIMGNRTPISQHFPDGFSPSMDEMLRLQDGADQGNLPNVIDGLLDDIEKHGRVTAYTDRTPVTVEDYGVDPSFTHQRAGGWLNPQADETQMEAMHKAITSYNNNIQGLSDSLTKIADNPYAHAVIPDEILKQQQLWYKHMQKADQLLEKAWADIQAGSPEKFVWDKYYQETMPQHWQKALDDQAQLAEGAVRKVQDVAEGKIRVNPRSDVNAEMQAAHEQYFKGFEKRQFDPTGEKVFKDRLAQTRKASAGARMEASKAAMASAAQGNTQSMGLLNATLDESRRVDQMARQYIDMNQPVWMKRGRHYFREQTAKVWETATQDKLKVYSEFQDSIANSRTPDFYRTDATYGVNDIFTADEEADMIINLAKITGGEEDAIHSINRAIREANDTRSVASSAPGTIDNNYRGSAIWDNQGIDNPVEITGLAGEFKGERYFNIADSNTSIPESQIRIDATESNTPSPHPPQQEIPFINAGDDLKGALREATQEQREIAINHLGRKMQGDDWAGYTRPDPSVAGRNETRGMLSPAANDVLSQTGKDVVSLPDATMPSQSAAARHEWQLKRQQYEELLDNYQRSGGPSKKPWVPDDQVDGLVQKLMDKYRQPFTDAKTAVAPFTKKTVDFSLLDYGDRTYLDMLLDTRYPYSYWYTRSAWNWAQRIAYKPGFVFGINRMNQAIADQYKLEDGTIDPSIPKRMQKKIKYELPQTVADKIPGDLLSGFSKTQFLANPINLFLPLNEMTPNFDYADPEKANTFLEKARLWEEVLGFGRYPWIDYAEKKITGEKQDKPKDYIPHLKVANDLSALLAKQYPDSIFPAGGFMFGPQWAKWDTWRLQRMMISQAAEAVGLPGDKWNDLNLLEEELIKRGNVDTTILMPYAKVIEQIQAWEKGELSKEEIAALKANPLYQAAAKQTGVESAVPSLLSFVSALSTSPIMEGEMAVKSEKALAKSKIYNPETGLGSRQDYLDIKKLTPETTISQPGTYTRMGLNNDLTAHKEKWRPALDELIKQDPANFWKQDDLKWDMNKEKSAIYEKWFAAQDQIKEDPNLWSIYGARPEEVVSITRDQILNQLAKTRPMAKDYYENPAAYDDPNAKRQDRGKLDFDTYSMALDAWYANLNLMAKNDPVIQQALDRLSKTEGVDVTPEQLLAELTNPDTMRQYLEQDKYEITPLDGLVGEIKDIHYSYTDKRKAAYDATFGPGTADKMDEYTKLVNEKFGEDIWKKVIAFNNEYKGQFGNDIYERNAARITAIKADYGDNIFDIQSRYFDLPKGKRRKSYLRKHPELLDYWRHADKYYKQFDIPRQHYKYKQALIDKYGLQGYYDFTLPLKEQLGIVDAKSGKYTIDAAIPGLIDSEATDYIDAVLQRYPWFAEQGWDQNVLNTAYSEVNMIPDSEKVWMIKEAYDRDVPLEVIQNEHAALEWQGGPLPDIEVDPKNKKRRWKRYPRANRTAYPQRNYQPTKRQTAYRKYYRTVEAKFGADVSQRLQDYNTEYKDMFGPDIYERNTARIDYVKMIYGDDIFDIQAQYFQLPEEEQPTFLEQSPALQAYWDNIDAIYEKYNIPRDHYQQRETLRTKYEIADYFDFVRQLRKSLNLDQYNQQPTPPAS